MGNPQVLFENMISKAGKALLVNNTYLSDIKSNMIYQLRLYYQVYVQIVFLYLLIFFSITECADSGMHWQRTQVCGRR